MTSHGLQPRTLAESLPNRLHWFTDDWGGRRHVRFSDALVVGDITRVTKGPAFRHERDDVMVPVEFDDPAAVERAIDIHVQVVEYFDEHGLPESAPPEISFRMGGLGTMSSNAREQYMASWLGRGRVLALLRTRDDPDGEVFIPILQGRGVGQVADDGRLQFSGMGEDERTFMGEVTTLSSIVDAACAAPATFPLRPDSQT